MAGNASSDLPGLDRLALTMLALHGHGSAAFLIFAAFQATWGKIFKYFILPHGAMQASKSIPISIPISSVQSNQTVSVSCDQA